MIDIEHQFSCRTTF